MYLSDDESKQLLRPVYNASAWSELDCDHTKLGKHVLSAASFQLGATCVISLVTDGSDGPARSISITRRGDYPEMRDIQRALADFRPINYSWCEFKTGKPYAKPRIYGVIKNVEADPL